MELQALMSGRIYLATLDDEPCPVRLVECWPASPWQPDGALYVERPDRSDRRIIAVDAIDGPCERCCGCYDRDGDCWHCRRNPLIDPHLPGCPHEDLDGPADTCGGRPVDGDELDPTCDRFEISVVLRGHSAVLARADAVLATLRRHGFAVNRRAMVWTKPKGATGQSVGLADADLG
jgi:hypothetical protein